MRTARVAARWRRRRCRSWDRGSAAAAAKPSNGSRRARTIRIAATQQVDAGHRSLAACALIAQTLSNVELAFLTDHRVGDVPLLPGTCYIEMARAVVRATNGDAAGFVLEQVRQPRARRCDTAAASTAAPVHVSRRWPSSRSSSSTTSPTADRPSA